MEKLLIRSDTLKWLDEEEEKLKTLAEESAYISEQQANLPQMEG